MAVSPESKNKKKTNKKRKFSSSSDSQKHSKKPKVTREKQQKDVEETQTMDSNSQWRNLDIVLSIQNKDINPHKKLELVFDFVISRAFKNDNDEEREFNTLSISRLIVYISNWIQSMLITSEKKIRTRDKESVESQFCLDYRCWQILRSCLEESSRQQVSLSLSRDLLRVISCVASRTSDQLNNAHIDIDKSCFMTAECEIYNTVNDCLKLLFCSHGQLLNGNLDLWMVTVSAVLDLVIRTFEHYLQDSDLGILITELSCLVLEQFSKFLTVHPCRKNGFRDFVEKLLEPLLHLVGMLPEQVRDDGSLKVQGLFNLAREIVSYGLFHAVHLDEYLSLHGTEKYSSLAEWKVVNARTLVKSYLRHLFDKVESLVSEKKVHALSGLGEMFLLFVNCVKKHNRDSQDSNASTSIETQSTKDLLTSDKSKTTSSSWNTRKSFFDFFVLTMEPLLLDLRQHLDPEFENTCFLMDVNLALKSVNKMLSTMVHEKIYARTEDNSEGACLNFFKITYGLLLSCYAKLSMLWNSKSVNDSLAQVELLHSVGKEFVLVIVNFLEIEYEVIGDDLVSTWLMILNFLAMRHSSETVVELCALSSVAVDLGCRVLNLYSELRQVNHALFALCRGLRHLAFFQVDDEMNPLELLTPDFSSYGDKFADSGLSLLCSQKFRLAICNAIKSIPEGQASEYVQSISVDISDTLEWMKVDKREHRDSNFHHKSSVKAQILGMVLSEIYSLVLDSIPLTTGNSYRTGVSLENLIEVLSPSMTLLIASEQDSVDPFIFFVFGITSSKKIKKCKNYLLDKAPLLLLFFFRLYVSCRSLYRQTLSLIPPKFTKKMSGMMADLRTTYSGDDLLEMTDFEDEGYFSWVVRPSSSLLNIMGILKGSILEKGSAYHSCLIYVMIIMTLQRLGDLKRQIQCVEYIVQRSENVIGSKLLADADLSALRKKKRKQVKFLSGLKHEASCLTGFNIEQLTDPQNMEFGSWDLGVCTVNDRTLNIAVWWIICKNIDIWCSYATDKNLKCFLSHVIYNSLPHDKDHKVGENSRNGTGVKLNVTKRKISLDLLRDTTFYDQGFVCRYIVSRICDALKKLEPLLFENSLNSIVDLSSCDWTEDWSAPSNTPIAVRDKATSSSQLNFHIAASQSLLSLLCNMMEKALSLKSFSRCFIYLVNFERLIVGSLVDPHGRLCLHEHFELFGLLVSCRRALRYLLTTLCENPETNKSSSVGIFSENPSLLIWLLKSLNLVVGWSNSMSSEHDHGRANNMIVSLMDQTSYALVIICKHDFGSAIHLALRPKETKVSGDYLGDLSNQSSSSTNLSKDNEVCKTLAMIVDALEVETKSFLPFLSNAFNSKNMKADLPLEDLSKLSSVVACVQGFLWGLECALSDIGTNYKDLKSKLMKRNNKTMSRIINFLDMFVKFIGISSQIFLCSDQLSLDDHNMQNLENSIHGSVELSSFNYNCLRIDLLSSFLDGHNLEAAYFLRRLLISSSAILRLNMLFKCSPLSTNILQILLGCSCFLLTKFSQMPGMPTSSSFLWLDGAVQFHEALGSQFPLSKDVYSKLVELNINAIGRCISLQGKGAFSASHDIESITKLLTQSQSLRPTLPDSLYGLDELTRRLRKSFKILIEKPSEGNLLFVTQALQQALTGVRVGFPTICDIQMGITDGGAVSAMVAAGVDCLDLLIEFLKGNKLWSVLKIHFNGLIASLFNIVVHLQGPALFYERPNNVATNNSPDSGSVVLMCVEVLTRIAGKPALFHLESRHVSQALHVPGTLFRCIHNSTAETSQHTFLRSNERKEYGHFGCGFLVDKFFSVNLYAASCRLLWTVVKHHKSDSVRCMFFLQASLQALLHCLERISTNARDREGWFTWELEEGVKCASYLRRVYEEIRQQKDVFGPHSFKFLSDYISVFSGYGSLKDGLKREVDEALRPGVYALIDVCSPDDLQHLHTVFGEGPRRSTLASLKHDYEHNFKYGGKV